MHNLRTPFGMATAMLLAVTPAIHAQNFTAIPAIQFDTTGPVIEVRAESQKPFTVRCV